MLLSIFTYLYSKRLSTPAATLLVWILKRKTRLKHVLGIIHNTSDQKHNGHRFYIDFNIFYFYYLVFSIRIIHKLYPIREARTAS